MTSFIEDLFLESEVNSNNWALEDLYDRRERGLGGLSIGHLNGIHYPESLTYKLSSPKEFMDTYLR
ncbi:MAG: hypothetical protein ABIH37_04490 [archaeon]